MPIPRVAPLGADGSQTSTVRAYGPRQPPLARTEISLMSACLRFPHPHTFRPATFESSTPAALQRNSAARQPLMPRVAAILGSNRRALPDSDVQTPHRSITGRILENWACEEETKLISRITNFKRITNDLLGQNWNKMGHEN
ncbi:pseudouridine synthase [Striga asiatica]|uniref:Pseudouridine synthase n=1 Tax=Striga asiatica TaxID=4170 RepID=A0A5A7RCK4_STRAF|nr:pseudouridine synthase [Striga asiatica]